VRMFLLLAALTAPASGLCVEVYPYIAIGAGYKIHEPNYAKVDGEVIRVSFGGKDTALLEAGFEYKNSISFGIKHDSQWSTGWPINDEYEYHKTELFIRYKIGGSP